MTREELDELDIITRDLRMAMDIKADIENNTTRPIAQFADGEKVILLVTQDVKDQIDNKITELSELLKEKAGMIDVDSSLLH